MLNIKIICVGKLKEKFYAEAAGEYLKRLSPFCRTEIEELPEARRSAAPSPAEKEQALEKEAAAVNAHIPRGAAVIAMCVEGEKMSSEQLAERISAISGSGISRLCFIIGGSDGLSDGVKRAADIRLSMSDMTFPHHLARVMLLEQLYRSFQISGGGKYHK